MNPRDYLPRETADTIEAVGRAIGGLVAGSCQLATIAACGRFLGWW